MNSICIGTFYECVIKRPKNQENGIEKIVKETIVVDACSFGGAESKALTGCIPQVGVNVVNINPAPYREIITSDELEDELFFKCKVAILTLDEDSGKEKSNKIIYLVQASSTKKAQSYLEKILAGGNEYKIEAIAKTPIVELFDI